jgi:hypothetical protein
VEQNEDAVVDEYHTFLTRYAAELVQTCKTSNPGIVLGNLANRWKQKIVESEQSAKEEAITELNARWESELNEKTAHLRWESSVYKKNAGQLNKSVRRYNEALRYLWSNVHVPVCNFHASILLICWEQEEHKDFLRDHDWEIDGNGSLSPPEPLPDHYFEGP